MSEDSVNKPWNSIKEFSVGDQSNVSISQNIDNSQHTHNAISLETKQQLDRIEALLQNQQPVSSDPLLQKADEHLKKGRNEQAIVEYTQIIDNNQSMFERSYAGRGLAYWKLYNIDEAINNYKQATNLNPDNRDYWLAIALMSLDMEYWQQSVDAHFEVLRLTTEETESDLLVKIKAHAHMGIAHRSLRQYKDAEFHYNQAVHFYNQGRFVSPEFEANMYLNLSNIENDLGKREKCRDFLLKSLDIFASHGMANSEGYSIALYNLAVVYQDLAVDCLNSSQFQQANAYTGESLSLLKEVFTLQQEILPENSQETFKTINQLAYSYLMIADRKKSLGKLIDAGSFYEIARPYVEQLRKRLAQLDVIPGRFHTIAAVNIAKLAEYDKDYELALAFLQTALNIYNKNLDYNLEAIELTKQDIERLLKLNSCIV